MASVTALVVLLAFLAGCVTFVLGVRVGHGTSPLASHLTWGALTLVLQLFAACIAFVHARASGAQTARLHAELARSQGPGDGPSPAA